LLSEAFGLAIFELEPATNPRRGPELLEAALLKDAGANGEEEDIVDEEA